MIYRIILDTNIYHSERTDSSRMQMLLRLVKSGDVKIIVPEVVAKEYLTKRVLEAEALRESIQSDFRKLRNTKVCGDEFVFSSTDIRIKNAISDIGLSLENFLNSEGVELYKIENTSIAEIFDDYFSGRGAFKEKKRRQDFPDAVIFDCIKKVSKEYPVIVITEDKHLASVCSEIEQCSVKNSLNDLFSDPVFSQKLEDLNSKDKKTNEILHLLSTTKSAVCLENYISEYQKEDILNYEFYYDRIELPYEIEDVFSEFKEEAVQAKILYFENGGDLFIKSSEYLGNNNYSVSFSIECCSELHAFGGEEDYEKLSYEYGKEISFENNHLNYSEIHMKGVFQSEISCTLIIRGIREGQEAAVIATHLEYLGANKCELSAELEVSKLSFKYL
ncbi:PIN domain-containing protein [Marinomonas gallaica]|uniref:PIN domain-containing protein n=1 Tax=Marinomonas gallaica TaxID=1806667 RepID=UPI003CE46C66